MATQRDQQIDAFSDDDSIIVDVAGQRSTRRGRPLRAAKPAESTDPNSIRGALRLLTDIAEELCRPRVDADMFKAIQLRLTKNSDATLGQEFRFDTVAIHPLVETIATADLRQHAHTEDNASSVAGRHGKLLRRALMRTVNNGERVGEYLSSEGATDRSFLAAQPLGVYDGASIGIACCGTGSLGRARMVLSIMSSLVEFRLSADSATGNMKDVLSELIVTHELLHEERDSAVQVSIEEGFADLYLEAPVIMLVVDATGTIQHVSRYALETLRYAEHELVGNNAAKLYRRATDNDIVSRLSKCLTTEEFALRHNCGIRRADGSWLQVREHCRAVSNGEQFLLLLQDVTDTYRRSRELEYRASHDALTGLVNRVEFESRLAQAIRSASVEGASHTLCYLDIDHFKGINDSSGHGAGDEILKQIARLFVSHIRQSDTIARLGGDEFAVLMEFCTLENAQRLADDLRQAVETFSFEWQGRRFSTSISIGLTTIDSKDSTVAAVMARADNACYCAKESGRNQISTNSSDRTMRANSRDSQCLSAIESALVEDDFILDVQSAAAVAESRRVDGGIHDMTVRLRLPDGEILHNDEFHATATRYGLSYTIDEWMIDRCIRELAARKRASSATSRTVMNLRLSAEAVTDDELISTIGQKLVDYDIDPGQLCLCCSESIVTANPGATEKFISDIHRLGCRFAVENFGSDITDIKLVHELHVDYCRISPTLVANIDRSQVDQAILEAIVKVCHVANVTTIAPNVDRRAQLELLQGTEVDYVQGDSVAPTRPFNSAIRGA